VTCDHFLQVGEGSPKGVWVCSTDMLLQVEQGTGELGGSGGATVKCVGEHLWEWVCAVGGTARTIT